MKSTATKFSVVNSPEAVGAGMVNALAAMTAVGGTKVDDPPSHVVARSKKKKRRRRRRATITKARAAARRTAARPSNSPPTRPVAFTCQIDGGTPQPCASPFVVPAVLGNGSHGFVVTATDAAGRSGSSGVYGFTVDTKAPMTKIVGHPKKVVKTSKRSVVAHFRLKANESPVTFYCQIDKEPLRICAASFNRRFDKGKHVVRVQAKDEAGNLAAKQAVCQLPRQGTSCRGLRAKVAPAHGAGRSRRWRRSGG